MPEGRVRMMILALALLLPGPAPARAAPPRSVIIVETTRDHEILGDYVPADAGPDFVPWSAVQDLRVVTLRHLYGPAYPGKMQVVMHGVYVPGVRLLVIAEPRRDGRPGFFALARYMRDAGRYCVPEQDIAEFGIERAFARLAPKMVDGWMQRCIRDR